MRRPSVRADEPTAPGFAHVHAPLEVWREVVARRLGRHARQPRLQHVRVDPNLTVVERRAYAVVAVDYPVLVAELDQVDRWQHGQRLHAVEDPLPSRAPVASAPVAHRQEVAATLD